MVVKKVRMLVVAVVLMFGTLVAPVVGSVHAADLPDCRDTETGTGTVGGGSGGSGLDDGPPDRCTIKPIDDEIGHP